MVWHSELNATVIFLNQNLQLVVEPLSLSFFKLDLALDFLFLSFHQAANIGRLAVSAADTG